MCVSFSKTNRIRLIVSSSDISEEAELQLTTKMNEAIKQHWVALGPRNYGTRFSYNNDIILTSTLQWLQCKPTLLHRIYERVTIFFN